MPGRNYIDVMIIEAVQEVQVMRGVMPAEYGGVVVSGRANLISKSGPNTFHAACAMCIGPICSARTIHSVRADSPTGA
jgi:outer membrane receptor for Fe3+-dicitrate